MTLTQANGSPLLAALCGGMTQGIRPELAVMRQTSASGRHGFGFHEACRSLFQVVYHPEQVPLTHFLRTCKPLLFPLRSTGVIWGHEYGGLVLLDNDSHCPWEDQLIERDEDSPIPQHARDDPYDAPKIQQLLKVPAQSPPSREIRSCSVLISGEGDYFMRLPCEIRE